MNRKPFLVAIVLLSACIIGCRQRTNEKCAASMQTLFRDFEYAGSIESPEKLGSVTPGHHAEFPRVFTPGVYYVFYHKLPVQNSELVLNILPSRLRELGYQLQEPTEQNLRYPDEGGPLFTLNFSGPCDGTLFSVVDRRVIRDASLRGTWASEAYILRIEARR
jgi:hypothetical protein